MTEYKVCSSGAGVLITAWQNLGARDTVGTVWKAVAGGCYVDDCWIVKYPAGCVREAYETEDATELVKAEMML
jgi:hypothetical protein